MLATLLALVCGAGAATVDRVAAVVDDEVISLSEVYELGREFIEQRVAAAGGDASARRSAEFDVLDTLIMRRLIAQEMKRLEIQVTDVELDRTIDDIARRNGLDRDSLRAEVERSGLPWSEYRSELEENLRQAKFTQVVIRPRIVVNEDELKDAWLRSTGGAGKPEIVKLGAIFLGFPADAPAGGELAADAGASGRAAVVAQAEALRARIVAGGDFGTVADEANAGPGAGRHGEIGEFRKGELAPELDGPAFSLPAGGTSAPIEVTSGVFLLHVFERRSEAPIPFEQAREDLFDKVYADRIDDETDQWYRQARRRAAVEVKLEGAVAD